jgi:hypothetical protein
MTGFAELSDADVGNIINLRTCRHGKRSKKTWRRLPVLLKAAQAALQFMGFDRRYHRYCFHVILVLNRV